MDKDQIERALADAHKQLAEQNKRINRLEAWMERQEKRPKAFAIDPNRPTEAANVKTYILDQSDPLAR